MTATNQQQAEALNRAENGQSRRNYAAIVDGFAERGITAIPRVDVFSYNAWRAQGRQVRKGQHGVKIVTFIKCTAKRPDPATGERETYSRPRTVAVFHISQTDRIGA